jgi:hypothetical protein
MSGDDNSFCYKQSLIMTNISVSKQIMQWHLLGPSASVIWLMVDSWNVFGYNASLAWLSPEVTLIAFTHYESLKSYLHQLRFHIFCVVESMIILIL